MNDRNRIGALHAAALAVRSRAYAPYSGFAVGAAILGSDGTIHAGTNVENAAYPQSQCAEASAIGVMVAQGCISIAALLVLGDGPILISPCGGCRQRLAEFAGAATPVYLADPGGVRQTMTLGDLLPHSFDARQIRPSGK